MHGSDEKSNIWCVGVGTRNGLPGTEIVRKIISQEKKFKYLRRTPNVEGKVLVLKLNKISKEVGAGYSTCAVWLGPENNDDESYQESHTSKKNCTKCTSECAQMRRGVTLCIHMHYLHMYALSAVPHKHLSYMYLVHTY